MDRPVSKHLNDEGVTLPPYIYQPLQSLTEIRVISLLPAPLLESKLEVQLTHIDRKDLLPRSSEPPPYEAMSYAWGKPIFSHVLQCGNSTALPITENVDQMLRYLRKRRKTRYLWIDAICLNQSDNDEKTHQVALMGDIYAQAKKVHIWLGTSTDGSSRKIFSAISGLAVVEDSSDVPEILTRICGNDYDQILDSLLSRSWFTRRWVLQEAALSKQLTLRCGSDKISWPQFELGVINLAYWISAESKVESTLYLYIWRLKFLRGEGSERPSLLELLWDFSEADCELPHDRLFALYGIASKEHLLPEVDYAKSWQQIYASVAHHYYSTEARLRVPIYPDLMLRHLVSFGSLAWKYPGVPSWVPDWSNARSDESPIDYFVNAERRHMSKSHGTYLAGLEGTVNFAVIWIGTLQTLDETPFGCSTIAPDTISSDLVRWEGEFEIMANLLVTVLLKDYVQAKLQLSLHLDEATLLDVLRHVYKTRLRESFPHFDVYQRATDLILLNSVELALGKLFRFCKVFTLGAFSWMSGRISGIGPRNMAMGDMVLPQFGLDVGFDICGQKTYIGHVLRPSQPTSASSSHTTEHRYESVGICFLKFDPWNISSSIIGTGDLRITLV